MERFFGADAAPPPASAVPGSSSLAGPYTCQWRRCGGPLAELGRFEVFLLKSGRELPCASTCSPECAAAYSRRVLLSDSDEECNARHAYLERRHNRRIVLVPYQLGQSRMDWLRQCRAQLTAAEQEIAEAEMIVQAPVRK